MGSVAAQKDPRFRIARYRNVAHNPNHFVGFFAFRVIRHMLS